MAEFVSVDKNKYKIVGVLTEEDITKIIAFKNRTTLILDNTVGLSIDLIAKITSNRVVFSIKGELDYETKKKYKDEDYIKRTFVSPLGLKEIIKYFEYNEKMIDPNWNEFEKAMFLYNALVVDMTYVNESEKTKSLETTIRSLNGILYGNLVCAGFALVYKEMLDRIGIKNYYQNQKNTHDFNIIEIDGKRYGVDVTWDNDLKKNYNGRCVFGNFAHESNFYNTNGHHLYKEVEETSEDFEKHTTKKVYDTEEERFTLSQLSMETLKEYYKHIAPAINSRKNFRCIFQDQVPENEYLPIDLVKTRFKKEASEEFHITIIMSFLEARNALKLDPELINAFKKRRMGSQ